MAKSATEDELLVVDNSILSATAKCHTYAFVRYALGLDKRGEALPLAAGSAFHTGMELWLGGASVAKASREMMRQYEPAVQSYLEVAELDHLSSDDARFEPEWVSSIFTAHLQKLEERFPFKVLKASMEKPVATPFPVKELGEVLYVARLDALVRKWEAGGVWSFDHKSTRKITDWWEDKQKTSSQWSGQVWIGRQHGQENLEGVIVHAVELPNPHTSDRKCREHGVPYTECTVRHATYSYIYITRSEAEMDAWLTTAQQLTREYAGLKYMAKRHGLAAIEKIEMQGRFNDGCTFCSMKEWCRLGRNTSPHAIRAAFVESVWDPREP
jgi:PD-(D/E)XK nuclease superfamily